MKRMLCTVLLAFHTAFSAAQEPKENFLDLTRLPPPTEENCQGWAGGGGVGVYDGPQPPKYVPFKLTLLSLDQEKYALGEELVFEVVIENVTQEALFLPWSVDCESVQRGSPQPPPGYLGAVLYLVVEDPSGKSHHTRIEGELYGSRLAAGSLKELKPGETARIRSPGLWQLWVPAGFRESQLPDLPIEVKARASFNFHVGYTLAGPILSENQLNVVLEAPENQ